MSRRAAEWKPPPPAALPPARNCLLCIVPSLFYGFSLIWFIKSNQYGGQLYPNFSISIPFQTLMSKLLLLLLLLPRRPRSLQFRNDKVWLDFGAHSRTGYKKILHPKCCNISGAPLEWSNTKSPLMDCHSRLVMFSPSSSTTTSLSFHSFFSFFPSFLLLSHYQMEAQKSNEKA